MKCWYISHVFIYLDVEFLLGNSDSFSMTSTRVSIWTCHHTWNWEDSFPWGTPAGPSTSETSDAISLCPRNLNLNTYTLSSSPFALHYESLMFWRSFPATPPPQFSHTEAFFPINLLIACLLLFPSHYLPFPSPHSPPSPPNSPAEVGPIFDLCPPLH